MDDKCEFPFICLDSQLGTAEGCIVDPEDPNCAKLSMSGKVLRWEPHRFF